MIWKLQDVVRKLPVEHRYREYGMGKFFAVEGAPVSGNVDSAGSGNGVSFGGIS